MLGEYRVPVKGCVVALLGLLVGVVGANGQESPGAVALALGLDAMDGPGGLAVALWYESDPSARLALPAGIGVTADPWGLSLICIGNLDYRCPPPPPSPLFTVFFEPRVRGGEAGSRLRPSLGARFSVAGGGDEWMPAVGAAFALEGVVREQWRGHGRILIDYLIRERDPDRWMTPRMGVRLGITRTFGPSVGR